MKIWYNIFFNLTYLAVTDLAFASSAPPKTQVKNALGGPCGRVKLGESEVKCLDRFLVIMCTSLAFVSCQTNPAKLVSLPPEGFLQDFIYPKILNDKYVLLRDPSLPYRNSIFYHWNSNREVEVKEYNEINGKFLLTSYQIVSIDGENEEIKKNTEFAIQDNHIADSLEIEHSYSLNKPEFQRFTQRITSNLFGNYGVEYEVVRIFEINGDSNQYLEVTEKRISRTFYDKLYGKPETIQIVSRYQRDVGLIWRGAAGPAVNKTRGQARESVVDEIKIGT